MSRGIKPKCFKPKCEECPYKEECANYEPTFEEWDSYVNTGYWDKVEEKPELSSIQYEVK